MNSLQEKKLAVSIKNLNKVYKLYDRPVDRLKESLHPFKKKYHKDFYALKNINLDIKKGEVLGIVGVNGAGKSTLLKIIAGVLTQTFGELKINGKINAILELGSALNGEMTGIQNIKLNLQINQIKQNVSEVTTEIIEFADIGEHISQPVKTYSSGMKARLGFAIATITDPDILIVDEVLAVGDAIFQRKCFARIEKLFKDGKTVIFVSHNAQSVIQFCSRAVLLYDRQIILDSDPKTVTDYYQKLIFSNDKKRVLDEIAGKEVKEESVDKKKNTNIIEKDKDESIKKTNAITKQSNDDYMELLKSKPSVINPDFFQFKNIKITNENGKKVNMLGERKKYILSYEAIAQLNVENVYFGAQFLTKNGFIVSGANMRGLYKKGVTYIKKNDCVQVQIEFRNYFLHTHDYIVKVVAFDDNKKRSVMLDGYIFKIKNYNKNQGGVVTLNQKIYTNLTNYKDSKCII